MILALKNLKEHQDISEETLCFSATIYVNGKKAGKVMNDGQGGCNEYHWTDSILGSQIEAWAEAQATEFDFEKLDQIIDRLIQVENVRKVFQRWTRKKTYFRLLEDPLNMWNIINSPYSPQIKEFIHRKYGNKVDFILNEDIDRAIAIEMGEHSVALSRRR
ncbi:MAG: hypothetical protein KGL39_00495 [Patescibacteria group bacterium]|nr:hypothetical protein [Patescibacteria group bacterium]